MKIQEGSFAVSVHVRTPVAHKNAWSEAHDFLSPLIDLTQKALHSVPLQSPSPSLLAHKHIHISV